MKVSELISNLTVMQEKHGDISVEVAFWGSIADVTDLYYQDEQVITDSDGEVEAINEAIVIDTN